MSKPTVERPWFLIRPLIALLHRSPLRGDFPGTACGLTVAALLVLISIHSVAQAECKVRLSFKGGLAIADQTYEYSHLSRIDDREHLEGASEGVGLELGAHRTLSLLLEVSFARKGSRGDLAWANEGVSGVVFAKFKDRIDYLTFLFAARASVNVGPLSAFLYGGPKLDVKTGVTDGRGIFLDTIMHSYEPTVPGLTAGFGLETPVADRLSLVLEFRYNYDLDIAAEFAYVAWYGPLGWEKQVLTIRNQYYSILAGLAVDL